VDDEHNGWLEEFRDGVKLWQLPGTTLPQGRRANVQTETREQELLTREKILRLWLCYYLENGVVKLVVPRFTVPKAGDDVRVVWDSKVNGHNACIWAPSFLLGDSGDLEEIVVKWLSICRWASICSWAVLTRTILKRQPTLLNHGKQKWMWVNNLTTSGLTRMIDHIWA
jgi:hypothetical protein